MGPCKGNQSHDWGSFCCRCGFAYPGTHIGDPCAPTMRPKLSPPDLHLAPSRPRQYPTRYWTKEETALAALEAEKGRPLTASEIQEMYNFADRNGWDLVSG